MGNILHRHSRNGLALAALGVLVGCKPAATIDLSILKSPRQIDDPFTSGEMATMQLRVQPSLAPDVETDVAQTATELASAPYHPSSPFALDVPNNLGETAGLALAFFRDAQHLQSLGRSVPFTRGTKTVSVFLGLINQMSATPGELTLGRIGATATLLTNGKVLIAGGSTSADPIASPDGITNALDLYDPTTGTYSPLDATGSPERVYHTAVVDSDGTVLLIGGLGINGQPLADVTRFDPGNNALTTLDPLPNPVYGHVSARLEAGNDIGAILVAGGMTGSPAIASEQAFLYRSGGGMPAMVSMPSAHAFAQLTPVPNVTGEILITGGRDAAGMVTDLAAVYDPTKRLFVTPAPPPGGSSLFRGAMVTPRIGHVAVALGLNNVIFLYGGDDGTGATAKPEVFVPTAGAVGAFLDVTTNGTLQPAANMSAVTLGLGTTSALLVGGESGGSVLSTVYRATALDLPMTNGTAPFRVGISTPSDAAAIDPARSQGAAVRLQDGTVLYVGGREGSAPSTASQLFVPCFDNCLLTVTLSP